MKQNRVTAGIVTLVWLALAVVASAQITPPRMVRTPDIHGDRVAFSAEGDLWLGSIATGTAERLTLHEADEYGPRFSPDGAWIAFTAGYDGGQDVYVMPAAGGAPRRLTYDPAGAEVVDWTPDGARILFRSRRSVPMVGARLYLVPAAGGLPEALPMEKATQGSFAPDGNRLAYCTMALERHNWKRYRGGMANHIWIADLKAKTFRRIHDDSINEQYPVWAGEAVFYVSEKDGPANLWRWDARSGEAARVTDHADYDVKSPAGDGLRIVYQHGDGLWVYDIAAGRAQPLKLALASDRIHARPVRVAGAPGAFGVGPTGKRLVAESRGQLFTLPAESGEIRAVAPLAGARSKEPVWSPDGKWIAFVSDRSGEENLWLAPAAGGGEPVQLTRIEQRRLAGPVWSPDSKRLAFYDNSLALHVVDVASRAVSEVARGEYGGVGDFRFSPDGKWLAYMRPENHFVRSLYFYNLESKQATRLTHAPTRDHGPVFDAEGKYLFFLTERSVTPQWDSFDFQMNQDRTTKIYVITLAADTQSPLPVESDEEPSGAGEEKKDNAAPPDGAKPEAAAGDKPAGDKPAGDKPSADKPAWPPKLPDMKVDLEGITGRILEVPVPAGRYTGLQSIAGKLLYLATEEDEGDATGEPSRPAFKLKVYDFKTRKVTEMAAGVMGYDLSFDRKKVALRTRAGFQIVDAGTPVKPDAPKVNTAAWSFEVNPELEWRQIFLEAWRVHRDTFYDPAMHGRDWEAMRRKYEALLPAVGCRDELNEIIGDMQAELNVSHEYVRGGYSRRSAPPAPGIGALGAELEWDATGKAYRIARLFEGDGFGDAARSPLLAPGLKVKTGDYLLTVNGQPLSPDQDPNARLVGLGGQPVLLQVNDKPAADGARQIRVKAMATEYQARYYDWVTRNRDYVRRHGGENLAYIHVPNMGNYGMAEFAKHFYANLDKDGLVLDVRYNGGGITSGMILERLRRVIFEYDQARYGMPEPYHRTAYLGRVVLLCNERTGSDGEYFSTGFRYMGLGPSVGTRTWGGYMAVGGFAAIDGGMVSCPQQGSFTPEGQWLPDGYGFNPDHVVEDDPNAFVAGRDPQLDTAIALLQEEIRKNPPRWPKRLPPPSAEKAFK
ncbi:MAG TPA: PDZ domain-containing protein [Acidobacteriota bacterium]|nr:PDZ domain-containing protein [Acidobacteriota bacterium]HQM63478.1 PDZ domain-containing protein [Acidobacteriota bacterium]